MKVFLKEVILMKFINKEFINNGSMWNFIKGLKLVLDVNKITPLKASSWIPLPKEIKNKKAVLNPKNYDDNKCFL